MDIIYDLHHNKTIIKLIIIIVVALLIHTGFLFFYKRIQPRLLKTSYSWDETLLVALRTPFLSYLWFYSSLLIISQIISVLSSNVTWLSLIDSARNIGLVLSVFWFGMRYVGNIETFLVDVRYDLSKKRNRTTARALSQLLRIVLVVITLLAILPLIGYKITTLLAFGSVGTLVVGFAAKDSLSNFFGGMMIFWDKPFSVGDWVRSPDRNIEGTVEMIGWRLTRIRTFDKRPIYVPNSLFSTVVLENPSRMTHRRIKTYVGVRYDDAHVLTEVISEIKSMLQNHPDIDQRQTLMVNFSDFGASSLNIFIYAFTKSTDWCYFHDVQQDVYLKIIQIIEDKGAECAFPTTTLHIPNDINMQTTTIERN